MRIALVNPQQFSGYPQPPIGLATLAAVLRKLGHSVFILDHNVLHYNAEQLLAVIDNFSAFDVVGFTAMTPTIGTVLNIIRQAKHNNPKLITILGGVHATLLPQETLQACPEIDYLVIGEGEQTLNALLVSIETKSDVSPIQGIAYIKNNKIIQTPCSNREIDLDSLPFPAYDILPIRSYYPHPPHGRKLPYAILMTSRGCPYSCIFCSKPVFGSHYRAQSPERVVDDVERLIKDFGVREIGFFDDVFSLSKPRVATISELIIHKELKVNWFCGTRVNLVDESLLKLMKRAGCYSIAYGIESGNEEILDATCKHTHLDEITKAVDITRRVGLETLGYFMLGLPHETIKTAHETINFAKRLKLDYAQFAVTKPFIGSELYDIHRQRGGSEISWGDGTSDYAFPIFRSDTLTELEVNSLMKQAYREFYIRPSYVWQRFTRLRSLGDIRTSWDGIAKLTVGLRHGKGIS